MAHLSSTSQQARGTPSMRAPAPDAIRAALPRKLLEGVAAQEALVELFADDGWDVAETKPDA